MNKNYKYLYILLPLFITSCATSYRPINPSKIKFPNSLVKDTSIVFQYKFDVITMAENKKYAKKQRNSNTSIVAIKFTNNTDDEMNTSQFDYYSGDKLLEILTPKECNKNLRQKAELHLLYLLLTPLQFNTRTTSTPIGLAIGPWLAFFNLGYAALENRKFKNNLITYSLINKKIPPKSSIYGLIGIHTPNGNPISIRVEF